MNLQATEEKLNPYQDYLFIIIHGINDFRNSFMGQNPEWLPEMNQARNIQQFLWDQGIGKGNVWVYSYTKTRGTNIQNAKELGMRGYAPPVVDRDTALQGSRIWRSVPNILLSIPVSLDTDTSRKVRGEAPAFVAENKDRKPVSRLEYYSYYPAMDTYFPTGVEPGYCFLEQARRDYLEWWIYNSKDNKDEKEQLIYKNIDSIPATLSAQLVPKKYILITHSMGNFSARLYIYSNELAKSGKFFEQGFYGDDVAKVVFLAPPMVGSTLADNFEFSAIASHLPPTMELGTLTVMLYQGCVTGLSDPFWPYTYTALYINTRYNLGKKLINQPFDKYLGFRDPKSSNKGLQELSTKSDIANQLKTVTKESDQQEPRYSIVYGKGVPLPEFQSVGAGKIAYDLLQGSHVLDPRTYNYLNTLKQFFIIDIWDLALNASALALDHRWQNLNDEGKFLGYLNTIGMQGLVKFVIDGDGALSVSNAEAYDVSHLGDNSKTKRYSFVSETSAINSIVTKLPSYVAMAETEALALQALTGFSYFHSAPWFRFIHMTIFIAELEPYMNQLIKDSDAHGNILEQHDLILKAIMDTPEIALQDSEILKQQSVNWSGIYDVTTNITNIIKTNEIPTQGTSSQGTLSQGSTTQGSVTKLLPFKSQGKFYGITQLSSKEIKTSSAGSASAGAGTIGDGFDLEIEGIAKRIGSVALGNQEKIVIRGIVKDLLPKKLKEASYSLNFSGWTDLKPLIQADGRFELGPIPLSEGQNIIAFKMKNLAGYENNQSLTFC